MAHGGTSHICEIIVKPDIENKWLRKTFVYEGQGSSYRVAAARAIARLVAERKETGADGAWHNVTIRLDRP